MSNEPWRDAERFMGIAGPLVSDHEKASLKQAMFLLRYRARLALLVPDEPVSTSP